jgi:hypothetical protein
MSSRGTDTGNLSVQETQRKLGRKMSQFIALSLLLLSLSLLELYQSIRSDSNH